MTNPDAVAGQSQPNFAAPSGEYSAILPDGELPPRDDELRRSAAERLAETLDMGSNLIERCEHFANLPKGDRLGALYAAARLMRSNALVAQALANVVQVERRQRSIVERIQTRKPNWNELNSNIFDRGVQINGARAALERRLDELLEASRANDPDNHDGVAGETKEEGARLGPEAGEVQAT